MADAVRLTPQAPRSEVGQGWMVREGRDVVVFGYGPWLLANACDAAEEVERRPARPSAWSTSRGSTASTPPGCASVIGPARSVVTLDNHYVHGGQGDMVAAAIAELGLEPGVRVTRVGVTELPECGTNDEVLAYHGLDVAGLVSTVGGAVAHANPELGPRNRELA